ncbi:MAG: hypothetical protein D6795_02740 [Deltaproteobacteria bacterium]|nr:MAG: hypothetical protein D6795_02740 [Deltaproteobacteria bacterium]
MVSRVCFLGIVVLLAIQRLVELRVSRRNEARILAMGGREHAGGHFVVMKLIHLLWLIAMPLEVFLLDRPFRWSLFAVALPLLIVGQGLRYAAIRTLGWRWSVRIMTIPGLPPVTGGIYRYIRHPNYLGVVLELLAVPLLHGAWLTATLFSIANGLLLRIRIREEEKSLTHDNDYSAFFGRGD